MVLPHQRRLLIIIFRVQKKRCSGISISLTNYQYDVLGNLTSQTDAKG
ncbi:MAG TPA: hypothetical protein ENK06_14775 [Gammaproteobacteria bacterium]|nr:hypothetical protein [Gammaproteobacteria bacterium]